MFLETKREGEAKVEQKPSLAGFIAWLEQQIQEHKYDFGDPRHCALGQYARFMRVEACDSINSAAMTLNIPWNGIINEGIHHVVWAYPRTFGAALERARKIAR